MNKPVPGPRWYAPWRQSEMCLADDPADVGTAFGLELTLAAMVAPDKAAAASALRRPNWMQRIAARRRATLSAG